MAAFEAFVWLCAYGGYGSFRDQTKWTGPIPPTFVECYAGPPPSIRNAAPYEYLAVSLSLTNQGLYAVWGVLTCGRAGCTGPVVHSVQNFNKFTTVDIDTTYVVTTTQILKWGSHVTGGAYAHGQGRSVGSSVWSLFFDPSHILPPRPDQPTPTPSPTPTSITPTPTPSGACSCRLPADEDDFPSGIDIIITPGGCPTLVPGFRLGGLWTPIFTIPEIRIPEIKICIQWVSFSIYFMGINIGDIIRGIAALAAALATLRIVGRI